MKYNKLVRDRIPEHIKSKGGKSVTHIADKAEYWQKLKEKLQEEITEFLEAETPEELADILEVIEAIREYLAIKPEMLESIRDKKAKERGRFEKRIILDES